MNGFNISEGNVLRQYAQVRQLEIERLLRQYRAPSASETGDMIRQIQDLVARQQLATQPQTEPFTFSAAEVGELGMAIQEGWELKFTPFNGGYKSSLITPQKWEITEDDLYISPTGEQYSRADLMTALQMPVPGLAPETLLPTTAQQLTEEGREAYQKYQTEGGQLGVAGWLDLLENQRLETEEVFGRVFPEEDIQEVIDYINTDLEGFKADIREIGPTEEAKALLRTLEFEDEQGNLRHPTEAEIEGFFGIGLSEPIRKFQQEFYEKVATGEITPWEYRTPAEAVYEAEGWFKDAAIDAVLPGAIDFRDNTLMAITSIVPSLLAQITPPPSVKSTLASLTPWGKLVETIAWNIGDKERTPEQQVRYEEIQASALGWFNFYARKMDSFEQLHPELIPKPEYIQDPTQHPEILLDPGYWAFTIGNSLTYTFATMSTIIAVSAVATPAVGLPAGLMMAGGAESGGMVRELMDMGVPFDEAVKWGGLYGLFAGTIEVASDLPFLGLISPQMKAATKPLLTTMRKAFTNLVLRRVGVGLALSFTEGIEEGLTQIGHNAILKYYDDTQSIWEGVGHSIVQGMVAATPFAGIGGYASFRTFRDTLSPDMQQQYDNQVKEFRKLGLTEWQAQIQAANWLARSPEGEAALTKAVEAAKQEYLETIETQPGQFVPGLAETILQELDVAEKVAEAARPLPEVSTEGIQVPEEAKAEVTGKKRVKYEKGSVGDAIRAAKELKAKENLYVYPSAEGMAIAREAPPFGIQHIIIKPDGTHQVVSAGASFTAGRRAGVEPVAPAPVVTTPQPLETGKPYTATVYRGYKEEGKPVDEGLFGKGTYYTTNKGYAETYDGKEVTTVNLQNPFAIKTHEEAEAFWNETTRPARLNAINEGKTPQEADELAAQAATAWLQAKGHDGLIARNIIAPGDEIVVFEPEKALAKPEAALPEVPGEEAWTMSASAYLSKIGVHEPWIAEISPAQYAGMSKRAKAQYDKKRGAEWQASADAKAEWQRLILEAYHAGTITLETPGLHRDARNAITGGLVKEREAAAEEALREATERNQIKSIDDVKVGDRVWDLMVRRYGAVIKKYKVSVRLQWEEALLGENEMTANIGELQWQSYDDMKASVKAAMVGVAPEAAPPDFGAIPQAPPGMPEAGVQPSMLAEVPAKEVRPQPTGKLVQSRLDDYLRLREYNEKVASDRTAEIKKLLEVKGRLPKGQGTKENLRLELARLYALADVAQVESLEELERYINEADDEIGMRHMPYHGYGGKSHIDLQRHPDRRLFREWTLKQLEEISKVYHQAREKLYPEAAPTPSVQAEEIPLDVPVLRTTSLTPTQIDKTVALFKEAVAAPNTELRRAAALELRKHVFAQRVKDASESAQAMIVEGMNPEEAIKAAEQMHMAGKLPDLTTDYFSDLTQEMRNVLFAKVYMYWKDKPNGWTELISTFDALTNALAGRSIPRKVGTGTPYFPQGGSAWDRLVRVFVGDMEVLQALDQGQSLSSIIETVLLQPGRGSMPLDQATVTWLKNLAEISEEDRILLTKPLSEITEADVNRIARAWFWERKRQLDRQLQEKVISEQEYKLELAMAKDRVFPHRPLDPATPYPGVSFGLPRLGEIYTPPEQIPEGRTPEEVRLATWDLQRRYREATEEGSVVEPPSTWAEYNKAFQELPLLTFREKGTIIRTLKSMGMTLIDIGNLVRANKASFDFSFWRQARALTFGHPVAFYHANVEAWKALWSQSHADANWQWITRDPDFMLYEEIRARTQSDPLRLLEAPKGTAQWRAAEEFGYLTGARPIPRLTAKIPWIKVSGRSFVAGCNTMVWHVWKSALAATRARALRIASGDIVLPEGEAFSIYEEMADYQRYFADAIQRASLGKAAPLAPALGATFFAARSKLGRLLYPRHLVSSNPRVRAMAWKDFMAFVGTISGMVMLGDWLGLWEAEKDPRNAEFMSIRIGNMRIDPWAGHRQFIVLYARLITKTGISSVTGQEYEVNPIAALTTFFRSSLAPLSTILLDFWVGSNFLGEELDIADPKQWIDRIAPFAIQDIYEAWMDDWQKGLIAILPAIVGEGVQTYSGDWKENWAKVGLPKYPENLGYGLEEPYYDLADFWADTATRFRGVDPAELTASKGFPDYIRSIAQALQVMEEIEVLPNQRLALINADPQEGTTFVQYYQMWQERERIVASGDKEALKEFDADERTSKAYLGNFSQATYALLMQYHSLAEDQKAEFLGQHPELYSDPRDDWLRSHPERNALLALWGKANVYSLEALNTISSLAKSLAIPETAMIPREVDAVTELKIKNDALFELLDVYGGLDDEFKDAEGLTARDRALERLYEDNPDFRDDIRRIEALRQGTEGQPTPEDIVEGWVERGQIVDEFGANSYEAKLFLIDNSETHQWALGHGLLSDDASDWNEPILRLMVQYSGDFDRYQGYGDVASDDYIMDDDHRAAARRRMLFDENENITSFGRAYYTKDAASQGYSENQWNAYVNYSALPLWGSWRERFLVDNPGFYREYVDPEVGNHPLLDTSTIKPLARDRIYQQFYEQFTAWDETGGMTARAIELMRAQLDTIETGGITFREARYSVQGYDQGFPEKLVDDYVGWYSVKRKDYEDDWWLMEHQEFYEALFTFGIWTEPRDFSKVPTREVWSLYEAYQRLPPGSARLNYRAEHLDLDAWLVLAKGYTPVGSRGSAGAAPSPWEDEYRESAIAQELLDRWREGLVG